MRRRGKINRFAAEVILAYNQPSFVDCILSGDLEEADAWEDAIDYIVSEGMEAHDYCEKEGWEYPPHEYWESWRPKHGQ